VQGRTLIIEGAGGLLVPLNRSFLQIELFARWGAPVVLVASTRLGTINHSLLSIEALQRRRIPLLGVAFVGDENADSERTITTMGGVRRLGRLPHLDRLDAASLGSAFAANFRATDFLAPVPT
jgi:dethiobiotin synthetase